MFKRNVARNITTLPALLGNSPVSHANFNVTSPSLKFGNCHSQVALDIALPTLAILARKVALNITLPALLGNYRTQDSNCYRDSTQDVLDESN